MVSTGEQTSDVDSLYFLIRLFLYFSTGANWAAIAAMLPGRTDNHVWRRWKELNGEVPLLLACLIHQAK